MREAVSNAALVTHHDHVDVTLLSEIRKKEKEKAAKKNIHLTYDALRHNISSEFITDLN